MSSPFDYKLASDASERQLAHPIVDDAFPYRAYSAVHDARTSKSHRAMERLGIGGTNIYYKDDAAWKAFRPPWGPRHCRCGWYPQSVEQAAKLGVQEAKDWWIRAMEMAAEHGGSPYQFLTRTEPPKHQHVTLPPFSPDSVCEPGALYVTDNPLILDDLRSGVEFRVERAMKDLRSLVTCERKHLRLRDALMTVPELIGMADALMKVGKNDLVAWPALISCFVSQVSRQHHVERDSRQTLVFEAMRYVLDAGDTTERELILPIWIASEDANPQTLVEILTCKHWDVRKAAAERLGQSGQAGMVALAPLNLLLADRSKYVRAAASDAINRLSAQK